MFSDYIAELDFDELIEQQSSVTRITDKNFYKFITALSKEEDRDSYAVSAAYYAFTGRRGLWIYQYEGTYIPFCWHPNVAGQILVFPPRGEKDFAAIEHLIKVLPESADKLLLARFKSEDILRLKIQKSFCQQLTFAPIEETVLDWQYPVRILSTEKIVKVQGHGYMQIRNHLRQAQKRSIHVNTLSISHLPAIKELAFRWAKIRSDDKNELIDLTTPYTQILHLFKQRNINLSGLVFIIDDKIEAVTLWDVSNVHTPTANIFMNLCNTVIKGLSEFAIKTTAEELQSLSIPFMNLGGSETAGLDSYKKKFIPAYSLDLYSVKPRIKVVEQIIKQVKYRKELWAA
ncbi:MAG: phosphatidylglycerol lysyltransferase domain-containing protein [Alphaproteobacteria bacterium]|nr:phosphatidylglycerol lysyltransferase domain-containing protein [Alphaproteobacteria bacterium]